MASANIMVNKTKLECGTLYHADENLEEQKEHLADGCRLAINKIRVNNSTKRKFALCKIVRKGDWVGVVETTTEYNFYQQTINDTR